MSVLYVVYAIAAVGWTLVTWALQFAAVPLWLSLYQYVMPAGLVYGLLVAAPTTVIVRARYWPGDVPTVPVLDVMRAIGLIGVVGYALVKFL